MGHLSSHYCCLSSLAVEFVLQEFELRFGHHLAVHYADGGFPPHILLVSLGGRVVEPEHELVGVDEGAEAGLMQRAAAGHHGARVVELVREEGRRGEESVEVEAAEHFVILGEGGQLDLVLGIAEQLGGGRRLGRVVSKLPLVAHVVRIREVLILDLKKILFGLSLSRFNKCSMQVWKKQIL